MSSKFATAVLVSACAASTVLAQPGCPGAGTVFDQVQIGQFVGGFGDGLEAYDLFGTSVVSIGDFDGDGVADLAVGSPNEDEGGTNVGAVWLLLLNADATVKSTHRISSQAGGFGTGLLNFDIFGVAVESLGDLDGDGVSDLAVGAPSDDDGSFNRGAVWILFMNLDGTVRQKQKISSTQGGFGTGLDTSDEFGFSIENLGDLDGDGTVDIAVGAWQDDDGGPDRGAIWLLFLNPDGTVKSKQKISSTSGGFGDGLIDVDNFGTSIASLGYLAGDDRLAVAIGAAGANAVGAVDRGAVWILFLNVDGTVNQKQKIGSDAGGFGLGLDNFDRFGTGVAHIGDIDGDGIADLAVGTPNDDDGGFNRGAIWILSLNPDGTVKAKQKISQTAGGFDGALTIGGRLGRSVAAIDQTSEGRIKIAAGAESFDAPLNAGEVWILTLNTCTQGPEIIGSPDNLVLAFPGGPAEFTVSASGSGSLTYQWRRNGVELADGDQISGANTPTLTIAAGPLDVGLYDCVVSNAFGSATSEPAVLAVLPNPCPADLTGNSLLDLNDINAFIQAFTGGCP